MKEVEKLEDDALYLEIRNMLRIGNIAVKKAKDENKSLGIAEAFWKNGKLYFELPNGEITTERPN